MTGPLWFAFILKIKLIKTDNDMGPPDDHLALSGKKKSLHRDEGGDLAAYACFKAGTYYYEHGHMSCSFSNTSASPMQSIGAAVVTFARFCLLMGVNVVRKACSISAEVC